MAIPSANSCALPGKVTSTGNSNTTDTGGPPQNNKYGYRLKCDYKSLDPTWVNTNWDTLQNFIKTENNNLYIKNAKKDFCTSLNSLDLHNNQRCIQFYTQESDKTSYYVIILNKLKNESNWWNDVLKCNMFSTITIGHYQDSRILAAILEVIEALPSTGWTDDLVKALNSIKSNANISKSPLKDKIDEKIEAYCTDSSGDSNTKCGCRNAVKYGKGKTCTNEIEGCSDVKKQHDLIDRMISINESFGNQIFRIYDPNSQANSCKEAIASGSNILNYGVIDVGRVDLAACFTEFENSGEIGGDVSLKCDVAVRNYNSAQSGNSATSGGGGSSSSTDDEDGKTAGIKNDYWIIGLCLFCMCLWVVGILIAVSI
jgi:hypothetical protein